MDLAYEVVATYHGEDVAQKAKQGFENTFQKNSVPESVEAIVVENGKALSELLVENGIVESKTDFKRLVAAGAIVNKTTDTKVTDSNGVAEEGTYKIGKHRFIRIEII